MLSEHELRRVLHMCTTSKHGDRNRMAVLLSHHAGLRVGEIASLTWDQVLDVNREIRRSFYLLAAKTKAGEAREVFLNGVLRRELTRFLDGQRVQAAKPAPIIRSQKNGAFSANSLCQLFARIYRHAGVTGATSHSGRRWFITNLAHKGVSPKVIMELAGHKQLTTTQRYIEVTGDMKSKAVGLL